MAKRTCGNRIAFLVYRFFKLILISIWFYLVPFLALFLSYWVPYMLDAPADDNTVDCTLTSLDGDTYVLSCPPTADQ